MPSLLSEATSSLPNKEGRLTAPSSICLAQALGLALHEVYFAAGISFRVYQPSLCQRVSPLLAFTSVTR